MPPSIHDSLLEQLAQTALQMGVERVELYGHRGRERALWRRLIDAGARHSRRIVLYAMERPYVVDRAVLTVSGLIIEASAPPRQASPTERAALFSDQAFYYLGSYRAVELTDDD